MTLARWKDLCLDATDVTRVGRFYADLLGGDLEARGDIAVIRGATPAHTIWVNGVPEPKRVKNRVHLDLDAPSLDRALDLGATLLLPAAESGFQWSVLADPEGGEFCIFERDHLAGDAPAAFYELVIDAGDLADARDAATWWTGVLGGEADEDDDHRFTWLADVPGLPFAGLVFVPVPEGKVVKNRVHLDVTTEDVGALLGHGAVTLHPPAEGRPWHVLADPHGNEFCAFPTEPDAP